LFVIISKTIESLPPPPKYTSNNNTNERSEKVYQTQSQIPPVNHDMGFIEEINETESQCEQETTQAQQLTRPTSLDTLMINAQHSPATSLTPQGRTPLGETVEEDAFRFHRWHHWNAAVQGAKQREFEPLLAHTSSSHEGVRDRGGNRALVLPLVIGICCCYYYYYY
jgi:hypothetical protein